jgi:pimeloyl-ACP methyl ester carboxylesterase
VARPRTFCADVSRDGGEPLAATASRIDAFAGRGDFDRAAEEALRLWLDGPSRPRGAVAGPLRERLHGLAEETLRREQAAGETVEVRRLEPPAAGRLAEIQVPTLVIVGTDDVPFIRENARFIADGIGGAELVLIEDAAHLPNLEHPERFAEILRGFLRRTAW